MTVLGRRSRLPHWATAACAALACGTALGDVWTVEPRLTTMAVYASNPQLRFEPQSGEAAVLDLGVSTAWDDAGRHFEFLPDARLAATGGDYYTRTNAYYVTALGRQQTERSTSSLRAFWAGESLAATEPAAGTLTRVDIPRRIENATPDWALQVTPRVQTEWSVTAESVAYSGGEVYGLYDYRDLGLNGSMIGSLTERLQLQALVGALEYHYAEVDVHLRSTYAQLGLAGNWTPLWSYKALYGYSRQVRSVGSGSAGGNVYSLGLTRQGETTSVSAALVSSYQPSGFGTIVRSTDGTLQETWQYSERGSIAMSLRLSRTTDAFQSLLISDRSYASVNVDWSWQASPVWTVKASPYWQRQRYAATGDTGTGAGIILSATRQFGAAPLHGVRR
jgi:hypothetical protein